jgi:hypothetical protein
MAAPAVKKEIKYLNKDFSQFRDNLINFAKIYFPETYNDFNESDPGMMFIEMASYVGDTLSYYVDKQLKESLLAYAEEKSNVYALAQTMGYKPKISVPSSTELSVYQLVPSTGVSTKVPNWDYALVIEPGFQAESTENSIKFICYDGIDFSYSGSNNPTKVSVYSEAGGQPSYYLLEKKVKAYHGELRSTTFTFTDPKKFSKVLINDSNIIGIYKITDSDGNVWTEVPYLAQDTVFDKVSNINANDPTLSQYASTVPYLLRLKKVPKRFVTRITDDDTVELQFGAGVSSDHDAEITPNPDNVGQGIPADNRNLDFDVDPSNFMYTKAYGEVPANTTLTVQYLVGSGIKSNVPSNTITKVIGMSATAKNSTDESVHTFVKNSVACTNLESATGGRSAENLESVRQNAISTFSTQNRNVTLDDYVIRTYMMPSNLGGVSKVFVTQDDQLNMYDLRNRLKNPLALNFYCLGYDSNKNLITLNPAAKENLRTYLSQYKMLTDAINIKDAYIVNFGVTFDIIILNNYNANEVLVNCINNLKDLFSIDKWQINQPIIISEVYSTILGTPGVQAVSSLFFKNKYGESNGYSNNYYDIARANHNGIIYPSLDPCIFEIKYPNADIVGRVTTK